MEKDLLKLDNEQCDDDFDKLLQGFLDDDTTSDDADTEDEDTVDDKTDDDVGDSYHFGGERNYIPEITKVEIQVQPNLFGSPYVNGDIAVTIQGNDDADFADNRFQLNVLGEGYYPMANTKTYFEAEHPTPNAIMLTMMSFVVWLPGRYTLYIRDNSDDSLIQMPFTLDDQLQATVSDPQPCLPCSPEDILTTSLDGYDINWNLVAQRPGMAQIRNFIIRQRQFEVYTIPHDETGTLKMTITALDASGNTIKERVFEGVPVRRNAITTYSGNFFDEVAESEDISFGLKADGEWEQGEEVAF